MDLDAFVRVHADEWDELERLVNRGQLTGAEADRLVLLYQRAATHLSAVRSAAPDPALVGRLSSLVARARSRLTGSREPVWRDVARFFVVSFPAALWRIRWWTAGVTAAFVLVSFAAGFWVAADPAVQATMGSDAEIRRLVESDFESYYSESPATSFAARVWTNNAWIAAQSVAFGVTGVWVVWVLLQNALNVGAVGGLMAAHDRADVFFGLILPHGLLELTAVFVAAAAGLRVFWAWVDPGPRTRSQSLAAEGRALITVAMGLVVVLLVSGVIEAFVTPSPLPTWARITIGALALGAFLAYAAVYGRRAAAAGETGDVRSEFAGDVTPTAG
ncbi:MAG: stage II sporulation protein M [Actinomycetota bacterium]